jgi:hypothetical protein
MIFALNLVYSNTFVLYLDELLKEIGDLEILLS